MLRPAHGALCAVLIAGSGRGFLLAQPASRQVVPVAGSRRLALAIASKRLFRLSRRLHNLAIPHMNDPVGISRRFEIVRDHQNRLPQPPVQIPQQFQHRR